MTKWIATFMLLSSLSVQARTPEEVVKQLYTTHLATQNMRKTVQLEPRCFTPGFLGIIERALQGAPPKPWVDVDIFANNQMGLGDFQVGPAKINPPNAQVPITMWVGRRAHQRAGKPYQAVVYLTDVGDGDGFQILNLEFLPDGDHPKSFRVREWLVPISQGR